MRVFVLDGLIGVGKSTVLNALAREENQGVAVVTEPVDAWEESGLLDAMYNGNMSKGQFQIMALSTRVLRMLSALRDPAVHTVIMERSPWSDRDVFAKLHLTDEWDLRAYNTIFKEISSALSGITPHVLMLSAPVPLLLQRMAKRQRKCESGVSADYLYELAAYYDHYFDSVQTDKSKIDASLSSDEVLANVRELIFR